MEAIADYTAERSSDRTTRQRLIAKVNALDEQRQKLADKVSGGDTVFTKTLRRCELDLSKAHDAVRAFDAKVQKRETAATSSDAKRAGKAFAEKLKEWEASLQIFAADTRELLAAADDFARASGERDSGRFPHRHHVVRAVISRAHDVLNGSGLKFDSFAPGMSTRNLVEKWLSDGD